MFIRRTEYLENITVDDFRSYCEYLSEKYTIIFHSIRPGYGHDIEEATITYEVRMEKQITINWKEKEN